MPGGVIRQQGGRASREFFCPRAAAAARFLSLLETASAALTLFPCACAHRQIIVSLTRADHAVIPVEGPVALNIPAEL